MAKLTFAVLFFMYSVAGFFNVSFSQRNKNAVQDALNKAWVKSGMGTEEDLKEDGNDTGAWDARVYSMSGKVEVRPTGYPEDKWVRAENGMPLESGDVLRTGAKAAVEISLNDGGIVQLGPRSSMEISSLVQADTIFSLAEGSFLAKIKKFTDESFNMAVHTPVAVAAVRGTEFAVENSEDRTESHVGVFEEGSVAVSGVDKEGNLLGEGAVLENNQETSVKIGMARFAVTRLRLLARHRTKIAQIRARFSSLKARWLMMRAQKRDELRQDILEKREQFRQKAAENRRKAQERKKKTE